MVSSNSFTLNGINIYLYFFKIKTHVINNLKIVALSGFDDDVE